MGEDDCLDTRYRGGGLCDGVRTAVAAGAGWSATAQLVAEQLCRHLPSPDVLTAEQRLGSPDSSDNRVGDISGFAPPGDIHRVHNTSGTTAISIHIYGTDVTRTGSSVRRYYD